MLLIKSQDVLKEPCERSIAASIRRVSRKQLRGFVDSLSFPRHYEAERAANRRARDLVSGHLRKWGYAVSLQGEFDNVVAVPADAGDGPAILLGAHYDSVPACPAADDNASAVAACLECARVLAGRKAVPVRFAFFNREEDDFLGSIDFVRAMNGQGRSIAETHVFEMVGFTDSRPGSQAKPAGLPIDVPDVGDFLGVLGNQQSNYAVERITRLAASYLPAFPVLGLKVFLGAERAFRDLLRSDHVPFWEARLPAVMWTDTSEFRNPHYHAPTDLPDTLDYAFLANVTSLALCRVLDYAIGH
jgi:Zn-dependent M28 family amino/carboxypeptidase